MFTVTDKQIHDLLHHEDFIQDEVKKNVMLIRNYYKKLDKMIEMYYNSEHSVILKINNNIFSVDEYVLINVQEYIIQIRIKDENRSINDSPVKTIKIKSFFDSLLINSRIMNLVEY